MSTEPNGLLHDAEQVPASIGSATEEASTAPVGPAAEQTRTVVGPAAEAAAPGGTDLLEREGDLAADYLETLLDIADLDGDLDMDVEGDRATVAIVGKDVGRLVGPDGSTLQALQELTRLAVTRETGIRSRLMLDVAGWRADRRRALEAQAREVAAQVVASDTDAPLAPMTPFERKVVHDAIAAIDGVRSDSEGEEPERYVVIRRD